MQAQDWLLSEDQIAAQLDQAAAARDLRELGRLGYIAGKQHFEIRHRAWATSWRVEAEISAEMRAAPYPPQPVGDSFRCFQCWHYEQRAAWQSRRDDRWSRELNPHLRDHPLASMNALPILRLTVLACPPHKAVLLQHIDLTGLEPCAGHLHPP